MGNATTHVTITNRWYNGTTDTETLHSVTLYAVSCQPATRTGVTSSGLQAGNLYRFRLFDTTGYAPAQDWTGTDGWTVKPGSDITWEGQKLTVTAVHDNRHGRLAPHIYVEAE